VGVIPAAGYAERLQPLECSKELLSIAGRPVIDYLVERMRAGGCSELRVVTRPEKEDVIAYASEIEASVVLGYPANINESLAAGMEGLSPDGIVLLGFPDSLWEPVDGFKPLLRAVAGGREVALGLFRSPGLVGSDFLSFDDSGAIAGFHIKPADPPSDWIWGCAAARVRALDGLIEEEWPSTHMDSLRRRGDGLVGIRLSDQYLDIGTRESLARAPQVWPAPSF
jgi:glucose-1-phosphate thymidylyltransferase